MEAVLVLRDNKNQVLRNMPWVEGDNAHLVVRLDSRRMEVVDDLKQLEYDAVDYEVLATLKRDELIKNGFTFPNGTTLQLVQNVDQVQLNEPVHAEDKKTWRVSFFATLALATIGMTLMLSQRSKDPVVLATAPVQPEKIVKLVRKVEIKRAPVNITHRLPNVMSPNVAMKASSPSKSVSRMGALGVLGNLKGSGKQTGLNLGATQTTAGPGLGGTGGSGGVQKSLYGKGLIAAPLGEGGNVQGGGGYGTKGRGGGQAGYGKMSLTGSAGTATIPLGREAIVSGDGLGGEGGLDKDVIAAVVERNRGQITFCYEQGLQNDPSIAGRVVLAWTIGGDGLVKVANVANSSLQSRIVEDCIVSRLKGWKFPLPAGGAHVEVTYPFMLNRRG